MAHPAELAAPPQWERQRLPRPHPQLPPTQAVEGAVAEVEVAEAVEVAEGVEAGIIEEEEVGTARRTPEEDHAWFSKVMWKALL